jgi:HK97 family phage major capsid protein
MTVDGFVNFIYDELYEKMFKAKINAVIYGNPSNNEPTGLTNGLTAVTTGETPIDVIANTKASLTEKAKKGARVYISSAVADAIRFYKNENGNYPYLVGLPTGIEEDPNLKNYDIAVGNMRNYVWNEQEDMRLDRDIDMRGRTVIYGAYQVVDGAPKANSFGYGQYTPSV